MILFFFFLEVFTELPLLLLFCEFDLLEGDEVSGLDLDGTRFYTFDVETVSM